MVSSTVISSDTAVSAAVQRCSWQNLRANTGGGFHELDSLDELVTAGRLIVMSPSVVGALSLKIHVQHPHQTLHIMPYDKFQIRVKNEFKFQMTLTLEYCNKVYLARHGVKWQDQYIMPYDFQTTLNPEYYTMLYLKSADVALCDCQNCCMSKPYRDARDSLLWRDKTCPACT